MSSKDHPESNPKMPSKVPLRGKEYALHVRKMQEEQKRQEEETGDEDSDDEAQQVDAQGTYQDNSESDEDTFFNTAGAENTKKKRKKHHDPDTRRPLQQSRSGHQSASMANTKTSRKARSGGKGENRAPPQDDQDDASTLKRKLEKAEAQVSALLKQPAKKKGAKKTNTEKAMENEIKKATVEHLWPHLKFITSEKKLKKATGMLFDQMDLKDKEGKEGPDLEVAKQIWVAEWQETVRVAYNTQRNYVNQQLLDVVKPYFLDGTYADQLPSPQRLEQVVLRKGMSKNAADREELLTFFVFYWSKFLPTVTGCNRWGPNEKFYQCIWEATKKDDTPCVTESDEAFCMALYKNCYSKWRYKYALQPDPKLQDKTHPDMVTPYTNPKGGQVRFGGWYEEGIKAFSQFKADIKAARQKRHVPELETEVLRLVREVVDRDTYDAEQAAKKKTKKGKKKAVPDDDDEDLADDINEWE